MFRSEAGRATIHAHYDAVLARWPVPALTHQVNTSLGATFVISSGPEEAPGVILLHGAASNASSWVGDVAAYSRHFHVHAVDIPGEPGRSAQTRGSWHVLSYAIWLGEVLERLGCESASLVGISQGGWIALRFATAFPRRLIRLALLAPGGIAATKRSFIRRALLLSLLGSRGRRMITRYVTGTKELHPEATKINDAIMTHFRPRIEPEYLFTDDELARLCMPVLLMCGSEDVIVPSGLVIERMRRLAPRCEALLLPGAGHALILRATEVVSFLRRNESAEEVRCRSSS